MPDPVQWPWRTWRLIRRRAAPPETNTYLPDAATRRADADRVAQLVGRVEILERRRDVQLRGMPFRGGGHRA